MLSVLIIKCFFWNSGFCCCVDVLFVSTKNQSIISDGIADRDYITASEYYSRDRGNSSK